MYRGGPRNFALDSRMQVVLELLSAELTPCHSGNLAQHGIETLLLLEIIRRVRHSSRPATEILDFQDLLQVFVDPASVLESSEPSSRELVTDRQQTFSTNRDTLVDVVKWLIGHTDTRVWFQPDGRTGLALTAVSDDSQQYDLTPSSNQPPVSSRTTRSLKCVR